MAALKKPSLPLDVERADLPEAFRWREWMARVEIILFASPKPVPREILARVVGRACVLEDIIADLRHALRERPYEIAAVAGGWCLQTRPGFAPTLQAAGLLGAASAGPRDLSARDTEVLTAIAYFQPITRATLSRFLCREVSRDTIATLRAQNLVAAGPRDPSPGAPYTYVTTKSFLGRFGFQTLRDLPDLEALADAGLVGAKSFLDDDRLAMPGDAAFDEQGDADHDMPDDSETGR